MYETTERSISPLRNETAEAEEMFRVLNSPSGRTGSDARISVKMKSAKKAAAPMKKEYSSHEYHGYVVPPLRNPRLSSPIQAASRGIPSQSSFGLVMLFDSLRPTSRSMIEATPSGRLM